MSTINPGFWSEGERLARYSRILGEERRASSTLARCLPAALVALDWFGSERALIAPLPRQSAQFTVPDLKRLLADIGFRLTERRYHSTAQLDELPKGSFAINGDNCYTYLGQNGEQHWWHDGTSPTCQWQPTAASVTLLYVTPDPRYLPIDAPQPMWFNRLLNRARREIAGTIFVSLVINILALAVSFFIMTVYNNVIPTGISSTLWALSAAAFIAIIGGWLLRLGRARVLAHIGAWAGANIGPAVVRKTLGLPIEISSRSGVQNNINRMRSLESVRQFLGGSGGTALIDYPFVVVFLIVIAIWGGWIVFIPILGLGALAAARHLFVPLIYQRTAAVSAASNQLMNEVSACALRLHALQGISGTNHWLRRLRAAILEGAAANRRLSETQNLMQTSGQALVMLTVLATMCSGVLLTLSGHMSTGGLIATMMLIWRITTPALQYFSLSVRLEQIHDAANQLDRLMASAGEMQLPDTLAPIEPLQGSLNVDKLFYRYGPDQEPALNSISFELAAGQMLAIVGPNGSGKSTLLQCLSGVRSAQNGSVSVDGRDIRQFDPSDYRSWVGFQAQVPRALPLSVRDYLKLGHPAAGDSEIAHALEAVAGAKWWRLLGATNAETALAQGSNPWQHDAASIRHRYILGLADAILGAPTLLLLDDPISDRDPLLNPLLQQLIRTRRGSTTIVLATHRPDLIQMADQIAVLDRGSLVHFGPIAEPQATTTATVNEEVTP
ncbi:peptidase domain-containing ABC transporter [Gilvimarinus japonicus]|uniref:Peptidase domain-containing ABC transporter n=1 Tax=Gilvimarinus japonicus TaxID=1796469 RepID=A0ABV7HPS4_9GAMM